MTKKSGNRALFWTVLIIAFVQGPQLAIAPGIEVITTEIFPERALQTIQTVMALPSFITIAAGFATALLVGFGIASKKALCTAGIIFLTMTGVSALLLNTQFWHLILMNTFIGLGMGFCIPNIHSIMFDNFEEKELRTLVGMQPVFINAGGITMSVLGGLLITIVWYGGHLVTFLAAPAVVAALLFIPKDKRMKSGDGIQRAKLPKRVFYYVALIIVFFLVHNVGSMNLSTHLARGGVGDAGTAGFVIAVMLFGGIIGGLIFPKVSPLLRDGIFPLTFLLVFTSYSIFNLFSRSLGMLLVAMVFSGIAFVLLMATCIFGTSVITDPTNSATASMLIVGVAPGIGSFLSPVIITNLTLVLGGDSTRFRYQFTAFVSLAIAVLTFIAAKRMAKNTSQPPAQ